MVKNFQGPVDFPRQGIDAVEVAGAILQALLRCPRPARLKDIEIATEFLGQDPSLSRQHDPLRPGSAARQQRPIRFRPAGASGRSGRGPRQRVASQMEARLAEFSEQVGEVVGIAQWVGNGVTFVNWFESSPEFSIRLKPGMQLDITTSATSKLFGRLSGARDHRAAGEKANWQSARSTPPGRSNGSTGNMPRSASGESRTLGARRSGLNALSVPIFDGTDSSSSR